MKKKLLSLVLALTMMVSMGTVAMADEQQTPAVPSIEVDEKTYDDITTVTITKNYEIVTGASINTAISPAETFTFNIKKGTVTDSQYTEIPDTLVPTLSNITYVEGAAGNSNKVGKLTVTLPTYDKVGIYTYTITENVPGSTQEDTNKPTAGVVYFSSPIILKVTVMQGDTGKVRVAAVHCESEGVTKTGEFTNTYQAGSLAVTKEVTGNMGDKEKDFNVTVTFTAPSDKEVKNAIMYDDDVTAPAALKEITTNDWKDEDGAVTASAVITLKHGETVHFTNIPYDVTYVVKEDDYSSEEYNTSVVYTDDQKKIDSAQLTRADAAVDKVTITNNKTGEVDTGINLDSMPYILILAAVAVGGVAIISKKRREEF